MSDNPLVPISETAKTLIEEISKGIGGIAAPYQTKRMAKAEIEAEDIRARAKRRREKEDLYHQKNMEDIIIKAIPHFDENAKSENVSDDWRTNFFDKCKNISDKDMQDIWSQILAGEANNTGSYSNGTVNVLSNLDGEDAKLFTKFNSFTWLVHAFPIPLIFDINADIYRQNGITEEILTILDEIRLVNYGGIIRTQITPAWNPISIFYENKEIQIECSQFDVGIATLTRAGKQLLSICRSSRIEGIYEYVKHYVNKNESMPGKIVGELDRGDHSLCPWIS